MYKFYEEERKNKEEKETAELQKTPGLRTGRADLKNGVYRLCDFRT